MKHLKYFNGFLQDVVNLNQSRIDLLKERVNTIKQFIEKNNYEPTIVRFNPQGSWAHKTIIKPPGNRDFDADILMIVRITSDWTASDYIENLHTIFKNSNLYKDLVLQKTRCVRINYANDFHIDLIPIIEVIQGNEHKYFNCNRREDEFEETAPEAYTNWWNDKNKNIGNNQLRLVTRLLKYIRDIKSTFSCKSVLLTTLVGNQVYDTPYSAQDFSDLPTSLRTIVLRLDDWLQEHPDMPLIKNPVLPSEDYNRHWDQKKYSNFRERIRKYREWIDDAYNEPDKDESILKWRHIFGDEFAESADVKSSTPQLAKLFQFANEWLTKVKSFGPQELRKFPTNFNHVKPAQWSTDRESQVVYIKAELTREKNGTIERKMQSGEIIPTDFWIKFRAFMSLGLPSTFRVEWRVVNTGGEAFRAKQRRGDFCNSNQHAVRWEETRYRGVHWVEAFVINKRTERLVGKSERFFVLVE